MTNTTFAVGGDLSVRRLGFGAMRITGPGIWGPPRDRAAALAVLRALPSLGIDFIDTADAYGHVATKAGLTRQGPAAWAPVGRPEYLRQCCEMSLRRLGVDTIDLWQL